MVTGWNLLWMRDEHISESRTPASGSVVETDSF